MRRIWLLAVLALVVGACGDGSESSSGNGGDGEERTVLVDYKHDEFTSAFLSYYPKAVKIRPGDSVKFRQDWTGEPHSVTMGKIVDDFIENFETFREYDSPEAALAAGETQETVDRVSETFSKFPAMTKGFEIVAAGAEPCYVDDVADAPLVYDVETDAVLLDAVCPTKGSPQPEFNGRQALYNSGFIPYEGKRANEFTVDIAKDTTPGTYQYYCNYHFIFMGGSVEVVEPGTKIPSQSEVSKQARKEIEADAAEPAAKAKQARAVKPGAQVDGVTLPLAGRAINPENMSQAIINEFLPKEQTSKVGDKVTWTFDGSVHTVSFNVPKYFPIFRVSEKDGSVVWDPQSHEPVGFDVPKQDTLRQEETPPPVTADAGKWDGKGGFHSSGALNPGDTFSVTFTKPGTYSYACVLHPQMVGTLVVKS